MFKLLKLKNIKSKRKEAKMLNKKLGEATIDELEARMKELKSMGSEALPQDNIKNDESDVATDGTDNSDGNNNEANKLADVAAEVNSSEIGVSDNEKDNDNNTSDIETIVSKLIYPIAQRIAAIEGQLIAPKSPEQIVEQKVGRSNTVVPPDANNGVNDELSQVLATMRNKR